MHTPQNKQNGQEYDDNSNKTQEIDSWSNFEYALREENRLLFHNMLYECKENKDLIKAANSKDAMFLSRITVHGIDIAAAKDHKRIDCQSIRTEKIGSRRYRSKFSFGIRGLEILI